VRVANVVFPLTPALSLKERENPRQMFGESSIVGNSEDRALLFPLPKGEGQGEGKQLAVSRFIAAVLRD